MKNFKIITVDGGSGVGKTSVSKVVCKKLGFKGLDTGSLYRLVALLYFQKGGVLGKVNKSLAVECAKSIFDGDFYEKYKNSKDIRQEHISMLASEISRIPELRLALLDVQRNFVKNKDSSGFIFEGRACGIVLFPNADLKLFLTATSKEKANRRYKQKLEMGIEEDYEKILEMIELRDKNDSERKVAPLKPASDAIVVDTTDMSFDEVVDFCIDKISKI